MKNVLIVSGHPNLKASIANAAIMEEVAKALPEAEIRKLDEMYPTYQFDIAAEQEALLKADVIVWQFPFSWYSVPGLMKLWIDLVYVHGFAHGSTGKLGGKKLIVSFTAGAPDAVYQKDGFFGHEVPEYVAQFESTAKLCSLDLQEPVYTCGLSYINRENEEAVEAQRATAREHAARLVEAIKKAAA